MYRHARTGGFLYQAALRRHLTERLGVDWAPAKRGMAEMAGWDQRVLRAFSRRRTQIEAALTAAGIHSARAAEVAALATRPAKDLDVSLPELQAEWRDRAQRLGVTGEVVRALTGAPRRVGGVRVDPGTVAEAVVDEQSTFARRDVIRVIAEATLEGAAVADIEAAAGAWLSRAGASVMVGVSDFGEVRSTTPALLADEDLILAAADTPTHHTTEVRSAAVDAAIGARPDLGADQRAAVAALCGEGQRVRVVSGPAGSGKTAMLAAAHHAWTASGVPVVGAASPQGQPRSSKPAPGSPRPPSPASSPASTGSRSRGGRWWSLTRLGWSAPASSPKLVRHATTADATLVLVGDPMQLAEIHAGGAFARLAARPDAIRLTENRRQRHPVERQAVAALRAGNAERTLELLDGQGRVHRAAPSTPPSPRWPRPPAVASCGARTC